MEPGEQKKFKSGTEDSEDESEILEESPCGRWLKRREEVPPPFPFLSFSSDLLAREDNK